MTRPIVTSIALLLALASVSPASAASERAGSPGEAILALERAKLASPRDHDVAARLAAARAHAGVPQPQHSRVDDAVATLTTDEWTWLSLGAGLFTCCFVVAWAWRYRPAATRGLAMTGVAITALGITGAVISAPDPDRAIVTTTTTARLSPFTGAEAVFEALEGESVQIERERPGFFFVRDADRGGWIPQTAVSRIVPDA
jgi:hypothetical protein